MHKWILMAPLFVSVSLGWCQTTNAKKDRQSNATPPTVIARLALRNQTAPIPTTTIFVPQRDGVFRLSLYTTLTQYAPSNNVWIFQLGWTDEEGLRSNNLIWMPSASHGCALPQSGYACGPVITFEAKAGQPVTYQVQGTADGSVYAMFFAIERLM
jgi:hypothetical protein